MSLEFGEVIFARFRIALSQRQRVTRCCWRFAFNMVTLQAADGLGLGFM